MTLTPNDRLKLSQTLNAILPEQLDEIIFTLSPPPGIIPPIAATQGARVAALLRWAEAPGGCTIASLEQVLNTVINLKSGVVGSEKPVENQIMSRFSSWNSEEGRLGASFLPFEWSMSTLKLPKIPFPSVRMSWRRILPIFGLTVISGGVVGVGVIMLILNIPPTAVTTPRAIPVNLQTLERKTIVDSYSSVGYLKARQETSIAHGIMDVNILIPTNYDSYLKVGLPVELLKPDYDVKIRGKLTYISSTVEENQLIRVKFNFTNDGTFRDRQFVRVRVIWGTKIGVLVPTEAVTKLGGQSYVFVAQEKQIEGKPILVARQKEVETGVIQGQSYQVLSGLEAGERVIVTRLLDLKNGVPISEEPPLNTSEMNK